MNTEKLLSNDTIITYTISYDITMLGFVNATAAYAQLKSEINDFVPNRFAGEWLPIPQ